MSLFRSIFRYVWPEMRKYKGAFFILLSFFAVRLVLDSVLRPYFFKKIIDTLSLSGDINRAVLSTELWSLVASIIILNLAATAVARTSKFLHLRFEINVIRELRNSVFQKIQTHSQTFFANTFSGSLVTKSRRFVSSFETMFDIFIYDFWSTTIVLLGVFVVLANQSAVILGMFIAFIVAFLTMISVFIRLKIKYDLAEAQSDSNIGGRLADVFGNILAVKIFSGSKREIHAFKAITDDAAQKSRKAWFFGNKIDSLQGVFVFIFSSLVLYVLVRLWLKGSISTGTVVLVQTYMVIIFDRLWAMGNMLTKFMKSAADMKEVVDILDIVSDIQEPEHPEPLRMTKGDLEFMNVSFKYKNGQAVFNDFNIRIKPGERVGVVGHSGAGKSTLTNLILRFSDVNSGSITIDGQDIRNVLQDDLRSVISYVPQESVLFHRTIRENIAYGKPEATDTEIKAVASKAYADEFIQKLPHKYDTYVGERGVKLSGGERQRVAIARAMIKNAPILILDEATSSLDSLSEKYIQAAFDELMKGKTTIVIAHRLSTIHKMDRIIVLEDGKIAEEGTHADLLEKGGHYADLWNHQVGGFIE